MGKIYLFKNDLIDIKNGELLGNSDFADVYGYQGKAIKIYKNNIERKTKKNIKKLSNYKNDNYIFPEDLVYINYRLKGYKIPEFSRTAKGLPIVNLLQLEKEEKINTIIKLEKEETYKCLLFSTKQGLVKRTLVSEFDNIRQSGKIAITLKDDDELISVKKTTGEDQVLMCSSNGRMARFKEDEIRIMGRTASGVRGINLDKDICVGTEISEEGKLLLVVTENGYGKKTKIEEYRETKRGSKGVKTLNITEKNGKIVGFKSTDNEKDLMLITNDGIIIRMDVNSVSEMGRVTKGVRLINLKGNNKVASISIIEKEENEENNQQ